MNIKKKQIIENLLEAFRVAWESRSELRSSQIAEEIQATIVNQFGTDRYIDVYKKIEQIKNGAGAVDGPIVVASAAKSSLTAADFMNSKKKTNTASLSDSVVEDKNLVKVKTKKANEVIIEDAEEDNNEDHLELALELTSMQDAEIVSKFGTYVGVKNFAKDVLKIKLPQKKLDGLKKLRDELNTIINADGNAEE